MYPKPKHLLLCLLILTLTPLAHAATTAKPNPRLDWWSHDRYGMFIHWGPASLSGQEISWSRPRYGHARYDSLALRFNPRDFDAAQWVATAQAAGMKYMVLTAKHHDGFCLWDTKTTTHNIMKTPFGRDVCRELADAAHKAGMKICWYFSLRDWKDADCSNPQTNALFVERLKQQLTELLTNYGEISLLWYDYDGWASPIVPAEVNALVRSLQPNIIVNNRSEAMSADESHARLGKYGDYATPEQFIGSYGEIPWETCANLAQSGQWSWRPNDKPVSLATSVERLMRCAGGNGNLLLNVGPDSLGVIPVDFAARLAEVGAWLESRSAALYGTTGGPYKPTSDYSTTRRGDTFYLSVYCVTDDRIVLPALPASVKEAVILGGRHDGTALEFTQSARDLVLYLPKSLQDEAATVVAVTTDRDLGKLPVIAPPSKTGSLAYNKPAKANASVNEIYMHNPAAAVDDDASTAWVVGRREEVDMTPYFGTTYHFQNSGQTEIAKLYHDSGWLEVDLGAPREVTRFLLQGRQYDWNTFIKEVNIQYLKGSKWVTIASKKAAARADWDKPWEQTFPAVKARKFRVQIVEASGYTGISEFQLY